MAPSLSQEGVLARAKRMLRRLVPSRPKGIAIPLLRETPEEYCRRAAELFRDADCQIYIDTSFLTWLTKIGPKARTEFIAWLEKNCSGRYLIPVWAAHEYQQHYVRQTVLKEGLDPLVKTFDSAGRTLYKQLHPFLQAPLPNGNPDAAAQQTEVFELLRDISKLAETLESWRTTFDANSTDVLQFINDHPALGSGVLEHIATIQTVGELRYDGRVPPGYQDRNKTPRTDAIDGEEVQVGSNRWGDLIFWLEVMRLAKRSKADKIVVLTNDRKNDWRFGGSKSTKSTDEALKELADNWNVPLTHPMLVYEAANSAGASEVVLVDALSLGGVLAISKDKDTDNLRRAASVPKPKALLSTAQEQKARGKAAMRAAAGQPDSATDPSSPAPAPVAVAKRPFPKVTGFTISSATLRAALQASRKPMQGAARALAQEVVTGWQSGQSIVDIVLANGFKDFHLRDVVAFARSIHEDALSDPAVSSLPLSDLVDALGEWDEGIASAIYLGLVASAYCLPNTISPRDVAHSPQIQALLEQAASDFGRAPMEALVKVLEGKTPQPIYLPTTSEEKVPLRIRHETIDDSIRISSIVLNEIGVFEEAQGHKALQLRELSGSERISAEQIAQAVCRVYAIPYRLIVVEGSLTQEFEVSPTAGLIAPKSVPRKKETP